MSTRTRHIREFIETLSGPIVFVLYFGLAYFISATGCMLNADPTPVLSVSTTGIGIVLALLTILALVLIALTGAAAGRAIVRAGEDGEDRFLAYVTVMLAILSGIAVLWTAVPAVMLPLCA